MKNRTKKEELTRKISFSKIIEIPRWCMAIIILFRINSDMSQCTKTISRKYHNIIIMKYTCIPQKSPLQNHMPYPFDKYWLPEWDHPPIKSEFSRIKTPFWKKSRNQVGIEWLCHECHEPLPSSAVEKCIMENSDFWFFCIWSFHVGSIDVLHLKSIRR